MKPFEIRLAKQHRNNAQHVKNLRAFCEDQSRFNLTGSTPKTSL